MSTAGSRAHAGITHIRSGSGSNFPRIPADEGINLRDHAQHLLVQLTTPHVRGDRPDDLPEPFPPQTETPPARGQEPYTPPVQMGTPGERPKAHLTEEARKQLHRPPVPEETEPDHRRTHLQDDVPVRWDVSADYGSAGGGPRPAAPVGNGGGGRQAAHTCAGDAGRKGRAPPGLLPEQDGADRQGRDTFPPFSRDSPREPH